MLFYLFSLPWFNYRSLIDKPPLLWIFAGLFLNEDDLDEANRLSKKINYFQLADNEKDMIRNILEYNWDTENQMVSNLLHFPHIMPDDKRLKWLLKGLKEEKHPYYVLAAATGVAGLKLQGKDVEEIVELLKDIQHRSLVWWPFAHLCHWLTTWSTQKILNLCWSLCTNLTRIYGTIR